MIDDGNMASIRDIKNTLNQQFAKIGHALSSPKRLELLELLHQCEKRVETLSENSGMSMANTSRHLQVLRGAGFVETRREGIHIIYRLADERVYELVRNVKRVAQSRLAEVERVLAGLAHDTDQFEVVDRSRLMKLARAGKIIVLDVRPKDEYAAAHIPHAISLPLDKLEDHLKKLSYHQRIVAYCRGPYCLLASEAVRVLRSKGFRATRLEEGLAEWKAAGHPVVCGSS
jgi:rhodanese-related sulfurtransferase/DNA-binding transcriptional ArsR family regulator